MNYYDEIKNILISNEAYKQVKDYYKNRNDLMSYYNVGKLLLEAGNKYGESIIKNYSKKLVIEVGKKYDERTLRRMRQFYMLFKKQKWSTMSAKLTTWSNYCEILPIKDNNKISYYINLACKEKLSTRELRRRIKSNEYERLSDEYKNKLINKEETSIKDNLLNPIIINSNNKDINSFNERVLKELILNDISNFMKQLGNGYSFIDSEYPILLGDRYNYIDLLLFNYIYNCFIVIELKVTELKKEHIGQIQTYMHFIDSNVKSFYQDKTIGIIICKKDNKFVIEYCSDERILRTTYQLN